MTAQREYELWKDYKQEVEKTLKEKLGSNYGFKKGQFFLMYYFKPYSDRSCFKFVNLNFTLPRNIAICASNAKFHHEIFKWYYGTNKFDKLIELIDNNLINQ